MSEPDRLIGEDDDLTRHLAALQASIHNAFALDRLYEAVVAYAAQHRLSVDETSRKNVIVLAFAGLRVEFCHDDGEHCRYVTVVDERLGRSARFDEVPPPPEELLGLIDGFRASDPNTPS